MLPPSASAVSFAARKRASNSTSEQQELNPQAKEFVMKREVNTFLGVLFDVMGTIVCFIAASWCL